MSCDKCSVSGLKFKGRKEGGNCHLGMHEAWTDLSTDVGASRHCATSPTDVAAEPRVAYSYPFSVAGQRNSCLFFFLRIQGL